MRILIWTNKASNCRSSCTSRILVDTIGADHILLGTDYPFEMGGEDPVSFVDSVPGLAPAQREAILSGNAAGLFAS